jgi:hypothetical protein
LASSWSCQNLRTGSIGNRDAETLLNTLPEPKKSILQPIRSELLSLGYSEEAGFDVINIESYICYSVKGKNRFYLKHKWELVVLAVLESLKEKQEILNTFPILEKKEFEQTDDALFGAKLDPQNEQPMIFQLAEYFVSGNSPA